MASFNARSGILISKALNSLCTAQGHPDDASGRFLLPSGNHILDFAQFARSQEVRLDAPSCEPQQESGDTHHREGQI